MRLTILISIMILVSSNALAQNKCKDANGKTIYSDQPCPMGATEDKMDWKPRSATNVIASQAPTGSKIVPPDMSGAPAARLRKASSALDELEPFAALCKSAMLMRSGNAFGNDQASARCEAFDKRSAWITEILSAASEVAKDKAFVAENRREFSKLFEGLQETRRVIVMRVELSEAGVKDIQHEREDNQRARERTLEQLRRR